MHENRWEIAAQRLILLRVEFRVGRSPTSANARRDEDKDEQRDQAGENRREKEEGKCRDGIKPNGAKRRGAVTNEPVSVLASVPRE